MDGSMIQQALQEYKKGIGQLAHQLPEVISSYNQFTEACFSEGALNKKTKHLIGLALGVYTNDEYCIIYHTKGAVDQGATDQEVLEAAAVCGAFAGGLAMSQTVTLVQDALAEFKGYKH
ncbi:carboxymuconolactone decarboxylase family protein [Thermoflavimicrobium dichotomicum]|uniref:Alkylhydroperoxidase AhpD family core domain-containing protein n=1 Tax=Thermoflavimicrobium dichotomicum TaxID=46223 RepID=A0A1I3T307_9BACL|nr:carboxymuconolactone decarboxylase family protein [Thermoflavimicrobium dichotomicum]SFJ64902.1 alkylhydroperoxidase AhpD family core domain-containing protein [Thermoflavimicrobium dichotomicum]